MTTTELFNENQATTLVLSGGTDAPAAGTSETWTVSTSVPFGAAATGVSQFHVADAAPAQSTEMIAVTNVSGETWTVTRGAENTTPVVHMAGFQVYQVVTTGFLSSVSLPSGSAGQTLTLNSSSVTEWANAPIDWINVVTQYGADPSGVANSSTAIQAAITAALDEASSQGDDLPQLVPTVYIPFGNYLITTPLNFAAASTAGCRITGTWGSRLFSNSSSIFDFQTKYLEGLEIDHLTIDATGGHCFTNSAVKWSWFHHLYLRQRSAAYSVWNQTEASNQLQNTAFSDIRFFVDPDPSANTRSVPGWNIQCPSGDAFAEVWFDRLEGWNNPNANGYLDTTQYLFSGACTAAATAYASTITFRDCSWHDCLGGAAWIASGAHVVFDGSSVYDVYERTSPATMTLGNDLIKVSTYSGGSPTRGIELRGYIRSQGIAPSTAADFSCTSDTTDIYINGMSPDYFNNTGWDGHINLNGAKTAVIIACDATMTVDNPGSDTIIIGNGQITVGGTSQLTYDQLVSTLVPTAWWKLADASGTTAADSSGNGWTGTATSVTFGETPGPVVGTAADTAALFGSSAVITTSYAPSGQSAFTVAAWVNMEGLSPSTAYTLVATDKTSSTNNGFEFLLNDNSGSWYPQMYVGNGSANVNGESGVGTYPLATSGWQFIVATFSAGTEAVKIYVNAVATGHSATLSGTMSAGAGDLSIGYNSAVAGSHFPEQMAQVFFISGTALTATQITALYNTGLATVVTSVTAGNSSVTIGGTVAAVTVEATIDSTSTDIQADGTQAAGAKGILADSGHVHPENLPVTAADAGYLGWNFDPAMAQGSTTLATGILYLARINIRQPTTVTNVLMYIPNAGGGLTTAENFAGLYNTAGTLIATTADQTTGFGAGGLRTMALSGGPYTVAAGTWVWAAVLSNESGGSTPTFLRASSTSTSGLEPGFAAATYRWATNTAGNTTLPTSITPSGNTASSLSFWAALS